MSGPTLCNVGVQTADGITLAVDVYLPAGQGPWPVAVVYTPYRKDALIGIYYEPYLRFLAASGYAAAIADFRGTGASGGTKPDAFEAVESLDVYDLIEGLADQPWCDGRACIWGVSYGGISALRAAAARPPHLRAVVAIEGSTDPYEYEVMRHGVPGLAMIAGEWASKMLCLNALPAISGVPAGDAESVDAEHFDNLQPWQFAWLDHPARDAYWQGREVDPAGIVVPTMIVTSWRDTNPVGAWRDFSALGGPRRIICGPWLHGLPDNAATAPIHSLREIVRWFDRWLDGAGNDRADADPVTVYALGSGQWESYPHWPPATQPRTLYLGENGGLTPARPVARSQVVVPFDATVGMYGGTGMVHPPADQAKDDARCAVFDSAPLTEPLDIVSVVEATLNLRFADPRVDLVVRLTDVDAAGRSSLITRGHVRLSNPPPYLGVPAEPPAAVIAVQCQPTRYQVPAGHRIRLAIAAADFPSCWPVGDAQDYAVVIGGPDGSHLSVPDLAELPATPAWFEPPDQKLVARDVLSEDDTLELSPPDDAGRAAIRAISHATWTNHEGQLVDLRHAYEVSTVARQPALTQLTSQTELLVRGPARQIEVEAIISSTAASATASVAVTIDDVVVAAKSWRHHSI